MTGAHLTGGRCDDPRQCTSECAEVDIRASRMASGRHRLTGIRSPVHGQRRPLGDDLGILGVLHVRKQGVSAQGRHPRTQVGDILGAEDEIHMRGRMDELIRLQQAQTHEMRPPLPAEVELLGDRGRLRPVGGIRHVIEFAEARMPGSGVVPGIAALCGDVLGAFEHENAPLWFEQSEHRAQGR